MKKTIITLALVVLCGFASADPVVWMGLEWTVDPIATAEVDSNGYLRIEVEDGDGSAYPWNVYTDLGGLFTDVEIEAGAWVEFGLLDTRDLEGYDHTGGPMVRLQKQEGSYLHQYTGGVGGGNTNHLLNHHVYESGVSQPVVKSWILNEDSGEDWARTPGEYTLRISLDGANNESKIWYYAGGPVDDPGDPLYVYNGPYLESDFGTAILGIYPESGTSGAGIYTSFRYGSNYEPVVVPEPMTLAGAAMLGLGSLFAGRFRRKRA